MREIVVGTLLGLYIVGVIILMSLGVGCVGSCSIECDPKDEKCTIGCDVTERE